MSRMVVWTAIVSVLLVLAWLSKGRYLTLLLDRFTTVRALSLPVSRLEYDGGGFLIGKQSMTFGSTNNLRADLRLTCDSSNRVILTAGKRAFTLGPRTNPADQSGRPEIAFVSEPADELSFVVSGSLLSWRAPFEFQIFGGPSPWWKRYAYYRLVWKKPSGAKLEMFWRYEQQYYSASGWTTPAMMWNSQTGLLSVDISQIDVE